MNSKVVLASGLLAVVFSIGPASAGGVIGDLIEGACGNCGVGRALDQVHKDIGQPLDHAGAAVASAYGAPTSPYCATQGGIFVGPWGVVGLPCYVNGMRGVIVQG